MLKTKIMKQNSFHKYVRIKIFIFKLLAVPDYIRFHNRIDKSNNSFNLISTLVVFESSTYLCDALQLQ